MLAILFPVAIVDIGNRTRDLSLSTTPMSFAAKETTRVSIPILKVELRIAYQASLLTIPPEILGLALAPLARVIGTLNPCGQELDIKEPGTGGVKDCLDGLFLQLV
jgi:hypothetical protein